MNKEQAFQQGFNGPKNMKRALPKIFGLGILAGVAALLLSLIAKLLIVVSVLGFVVTRIGKGIRRKRAMANGMGDGNYPMMMGNYNAGFGGPAPAFSRATGKSTIVPIS